jgi:hypothetical protein
MIGRAELPVLGALGAIAALAWLWRAGGVRRRPKIRLATLLVAIVVLGFLFKAYLYRNETLHVRIVNETSASLEDVAVTRSNERVVFGRVAAGAKVEAVVRNPEAQAPIRIVFRRKGESTPTGFRVPGVRFRGVSSTTYVMKVQPSGFSISFDSTSGGVWP